MSARAVTLAALCVVGCAATSRRVEVRATHGAARPRARAATRAEGLDEALDRGVDLREAGRDEDALAVFRDAWSRWRSARARAQMGLAEHALGRWGAAEDHLRASLGASDPWVQRNRDPLRRALAEASSHMATLDVTGTPPGAEVEVNGSRVGALPLAAPVRVAEGAVRVTVRAPGYGAAVRRLDVLAGASAHTQVTLTPARR